MILCYLLYYVMLLFAKNNLYIDEFIIRKFIVAKNLKFFKKKKRCLLRKPNIAKKKSL